MAVAVIDSRRQRVNVESMISFDGVSQYAEAEENQNIKNAVNFNKEWSVSFLFHHKSKTSNQYFFTQYRAEHFGFQMVMGSTVTGNFVKNRILIGIYGGTKYTVSYTQKELKPNQLYHIAAYHNPTTKQIHIFVNGVEDSVVWITEADANIWNTTNQFTTRFGFGADRDIVHASNCYLSHLTFFNRTLTPAEISYIHAQGGVLPASAHAACVAHYPCTQREGATLWDVVEQYNYTKGTALVPYHATLTNFTAAQHAGDAQTAYKDFYTKTDLRPYVDSNSDGTPDSPLIEKSTLLPPLQKALQFQSAAAQTMQCGNVGSIQGIRLAVKLDAINQSLLSLDNTAATTIQVASGSLTAGGSIAGLQIYVDGTLRTAVQAGVALNDLNLHDVVLLFNSLSASDMRVTAGDKSVAALFIMSQPISRKMIVQLANNTLLAQPTSQQQAGITQLYNFNSIIDNAGTYQINNERGATDATLSGYTAANIDPLDPSYALTDINSLR
jgi:hypothetical protein